MKTTLRIILLVLPIFLTACSSKPKQTYDELPPQIQALHNYLTVINNSAYTENDYQAAFVILSCGTIPGENLTLNHLSNLRHEDKKAFLNCWSNLKRYPNHNPKLQKIDFTKRGGFSKVAGSQYHIVQNLNKCLAYFDIVYEIK
ncbi:MAG TPA: hypothetical protein DCL21_04010 [Alphaproteobacteria bacterium]|nr:hypothetical protein [Alphaproteobacteria bacterium]